MIVGGYTLDLYCDVEGCKEEAQFCAGVGTKARTLARKASWVVRMSTNECYCPEHKQSNRTRV